MRADLFLYEAGLAPSRTKAAHLIESGRVLWRGKPLTRCAAELAGADPGEITVTEADRFVSRGGEKLEKALTAFSVDPAGLTAADIGASTGGFTDCLLQHGAVCVYAVDAGCGQLAPSLRADARVIAVDKCNARFPLTGVIPEPCELAVSDVSFISQTLILPNVPAILQPGGRYIALVKPQFECGPAALGKNGVVRDPEMHCLAIRRVANAAVRCGFRVCGLTDSPIRGGEGNREFLLLCENGTDGSAELSEKRIREVVES